ncbi:MAG: C69 family dipeptidase [Candidatus Cloacimonetes bacterium]|nr:C69 family dipeptidase [Candidatus Cloacimonadota bacterium]
MKTRKFLTIFAIVLLLAGQTLAACTVFAVGKDASADGSTLTSHTCDSNGDDFRLWLIPSMAEGTERDYVVNGRAGSDYSQFPEVKNYGSGIVFDTVANDKDTNQYLHSMYSFINDKGLAMGESTCGFDTSTEYGKKLRALFNDNEGLMDCYMIQDLALENCSTAREAVQYMGALIDEYGWNGYCEIMPICDGNETWVMEAYGAKVWIAVRVPDNMAFVGANRARIDVIDQSKYEYIMSANLYSFAKENGLWDGKSEFRPCQVYAPSASFGCTLREWSTQVIFGWDY